MRIAICDDDPAWNRYASEVLTLALTLKSVPYRSPFVWRRLTFYKEQLR